MLTAGLAISVAAFGLSSVQAASEVTSDSTALVTKQVCPAFLDHKVRKLHSKQDIDICQLVAGKTVLVVNTASNCGFTPQFEGLEALYNEYKEQGLIVLGFPSDDFFQEEDDEKDTAEVCYQNYGVTFPMFKTLAVRGSDAHPIFAHLSEKTASPKWNFYKYLISADGQHIQHFTSKTSPESVDFIAAVKAQLQ
jgi:glutathione peroxidase